MPTTNQTAPWQCQACFEDHHSSPVVLIDTNICEHCFLEGYKPQFEQALEDQTKYPVKWGATPLQIDAYARFFSPDFHARWNIKIKEYAVPIKQRIYCVNHVYTISDDDDDDDESPPTEELCGAFLGSIVDHAHEATVRCSECHGNFEIDKFATSMALLEGQIRGKDYQLCPDETCGTIMTLIDGCNEVMCLICNTKICYLCGKEPEHGHWNFGNPCPRFGNPNSANPIFDEDRQDNPVLDFGEEEDEEEAPFPGRLAMQLAHPGFLLTQAEEDRIFSTTVGRLLLADRARLLALFANATDVHSPATAEVVRLITFLLGARELYIAHAVPFPFPRWQDDPDHQRDHAEITRLAGHIGRVGLLARPGLAELVTTHNRAWAGDIEARAEALLHAEEEAILGSVEQQLFVADLQRLDALHTRWERHPAGGMAIDAVHQLIHLLMTEIHVYTDHLFETNALLGRRPLWDRAARRNGREDLHFEYRLMRRSQAITDDFPELADLVHSYDLAWAGEFEQLRALHLWRD